jgi:hypothetical protein
MARKGDFATVRGEVGGFGLFEEEEGEGEEEKRPAWMITFQHQTMFTSPSVNLACRSKNGISERGQRLVEDWLAGKVQDNNNNTFKKAAQAMFDIIQE